MGHRAVRRLHVLPLALCLAVTGMWVRSHFAADRVHVTVLGRAFSTGSTIGRVYFQVATLAEGGFRSRLDWDSGPPVGATAHARGPLADHGFTVESLPIGNPPVGHTRILLLPYWFLWAISAALPAQRLAAVVRRRLVRRRRVARGLCPACGYDLQGMPGTCPECGGAGS